MLRDAFFKMPSALATGFARSQNFFDSANSLCCLRLLLYTIQSQIAIYKGNKKPVNFKEKFVQNAGEKYFTKFAAIGSKFLCKMTKCKVSLA